MSKFRFRLATLLRLRETTRDERRVQLAETQRTDAELQAQLTRLDGEQRQVQSDRRKAAGPGAVDVPRLVETDRYASTLRARETELHRQRETLAAEIDRRRHALLEADREVQTLEKLRQTQSQAHRQEEDRRESKQLDEAALQAGRT